MNKIRLVGLDAARGLALFGMMATHVMPRYTADGSVSPFHVVASGRSSATFAVLAGVALALTTGRMHPPRGRRRLELSVSVATRALLIGAFGLLLGEVHTIAAIILAYYGLLFLLGIPFLGFGVRGLAISAVVLALLAPNVGVVLGWYLPIPTLENPTFGDLFTTPGALFAELSFTGFYPAVLWLTYLCAGMAVGRLDLSSTKVAGWLLGGGAALAVAAQAASWALLGPAGGMANLRSEIPQWWGIAPAQLDEFLQLGMYGSVPVNSPWWVAVVAPHSGTTLDLAHTTGSALAVLGAMLLLARVASRVLRPLAAAGAMTLTLYSVHVIALGGPWVPEEPLYSLVFQITIALALATLWRSAVGRGPLEGTVTAVSRWSRTRVERLSSRTVAPG